MSPSSDTDDGSALKGICTVLDQRLSAVADAVAALSVWLALKSSSARTRCMKLAAVVLSSALPLFNVGEASLDYVKTVNDVCDLCDLVRKILSWEALTAFVSLEGSELLEKSLGTFKAEGSKGNAKPDKKGEKEKKVVGKGTSDLIEFIKGKLQTETTEGVDISTSIRGEMGAGFPLAVRSKWLRF
ncbi:hypothetical protein RJ639_034731 [Escallonia herrerae]|uniref:Uncharacterized protein n=1 Tax=Escallonia herrerae TaxID=1293975 RepID=A0AA88WWI8_9ASTE|nr:hypothetical protein RJ639_034731 [Escallonia herrerae]